MIMEDNSNDKLEENKVASLLCPECRNDISYISFQIIKEKLQILIKCSKCYKVNIMPLEEYRPIFAKTESGVDTTSINRSKSDSTNTCPSCKKSFCSCLVNQKHSQSNIQSDTKIQNNNQNTVGKLKTKSMSSNMIIATYQGKAESLKKNLYDLINKQKNNTEKIINDINKTIEIFTTLRQNVIESYKSKDKINKQILFYLECLFSYYTSPLFKELSYDINVIDTFHIDTIKEILETDLIKKSNEWINYMKKKYIITIKEYTSTKIDFGLGKVKCIIGLEDNRYALGLEKGNIILYSHLPDDLIGHTGPVLTLLQLNTNSLCSGSQDKTIKIWDIQTKHLNFTYQGHKSSIYTIIKFNDNTIASGSNDCSICLWNTTRGPGNIEQIENAHSDCVRVLLKLSNDEVASGSWDKTVVLWDKNWERKEILIGHCSYVYCLAELSRSKLASGSYDGSILIWCLKSMTLIEKIEDFSGGVHSLNYLKGNEILIVGGYKELTFLNISKKSTVLSIKEHKSTINNIVTNKSKQIVTCCLKGIITIWNI